jgi:hypothetical protein
MVARVGVAVEEGGWTSESRGERCVHNAPTTILTCALKFSGNDVGAGRCLRIVAAYCAFRSNPVVACQSQSQYLLSLDQTGLSKIALTIPIPKLPLHTRNRPDTLPGTPKKPMLQHLLRHHIPHYPTNKPSQLVPIDKNIVPSPHPTRPATRDATNHFCGFWLQTLVKRCLDLRVATVRRGRVSGISTGWKVPLREIFNRGCEMP